MSAKSQNHNPELRIRQIVDLVIDSWRTIVITVVGCVCLVLVMMQFLPRIYRAEVEVTPVRAATHAAFLNLASVGQFAYSQESLLREFSTYLMDGERIASVESGVDAKDVDVTFDLRFTNPNPQGEQPKRVLVKMTARYNDEKKLNDFTARLLSSANADLTKGLLYEVQQRIAVIDEKQKNEIARGMIKLEGRREKLEAQKLDTIKIITDQANIARSFGLDKPVEMSAQSVTIERRESVSSASSVAAGSESAIPSTLPTTFAGLAPSVLSNRRPSYFEGFLALEKQKELLEKRTDRDALGADLRDIEEAVYVVRNSLEAGRVRTLLNGTPLVGDGSVKLAEFSLAQAKARKIFPRGIYMLPLAVLLGLFAGILIAMYRHSGKDA